MLRHLTLCDWGCLSTDGDRIPGIWFHPGTRRLHVRDGHGNDGNAGCDPEEELPANTATTVRVEMRPGFVEVFYDEVLKCTEARGDRQAFDSVVVYAPDPWHTAANAAMNNFFMKELDPISGCTDALSCNHDDRASVDDGSCRYPDAGRDCDGQMFDTIAGATYFVGAVPLPLSPGVEHAIVNLPVDYEVGFDITPRPELVTEWASIIHITATGNNCCGYVRNTAFRLPARCLVLSCLIRREIAFLPCGSTRTRTVCTCGMVMGVTATLGATRTGSSCRTKRHR